MVKKEVKKIRKGRFLTIKDVQRETGLSRSLIYKMIKEGLFPGPVKAGLRSSRWVEYEIEDWKIDRINNRDHGRGVKTWRQ